MQLLDLNAKTAQRMLPAIIAGMVASICWIIGDILIVGFTMSPEKYPLLSETYGQQVDIELATLMLAGSTKRLMWGALIAVFSTPFYLYSIFAISYLIKRKFMMPVFLLLLFGYAYSPLGHAAFFYVGEIYKTILQTDPINHPQLLETGKTFTQMLNINWMAAVGITTIAWIVFAILVLMKKTHLKKAAVWLNPFIFSIVLFSTAQLLPSPTKDYISCAVFNEANFLFFFILLLYALKIKKEGNIIKSKSKEKGINKE